MRFLGMPTMRSWNPTVNTRIHPSKDDTCPCVQRELEEDQQFQGSTKEGNLMPP